MTEEDLVEGLVALREEEGIEARFRVEAEIVGAQLVVVCEVYREINGVRLGLSKNVSVWHPGGRPLMSVMLISLHRAYSAFKELAYLKPSLDKRA